MSGPGATGSILASPYNNYPCLPQEPTTAEFLSDLNKLLQNGSYQLISTEDLVAGRYDNPSSAEITLDILNTHILVESGVFDQPNDVRPISIKKDGLTTSMTPTQTIKESLEFIEMTRGNWKDDIVVYKINKFRTGPNYNG